MARIETITWLTPEEKLLVKKIAKIFKVQSVKEWMLWSQWIQQRRALK